MADLLTDGVRYIELRTLDLDPFEPLGISGQTLDFIRLLFGYFILQTALPTQINAAVANGEAANRVAALESPFAPSHMLQQGLDLLADLQAFYDGVALPFNAQTLIDQMRERLLNPALTPAARLAKMAADHQLFETLKQTTQHYQQDLTNRPLIGFESRTSVDQRQILAELQAGRAVALPEAQKLNE